MKRAIMFWSLSATALAGGCAARADFTLNSLDGGRISLSSQRGKTVLLAFWAVG